MGNIGIRYIEVIYIFWLYIETNLVWCTVQSGGAMMIDVWV